MFQKAAFRAFIVNQGGSYNTSNNYCSRLNGIDALIGGLDEKLRSEGPRSVVAWGDRQLTGVFDTDRNGAKSALRKYVSFFADPDGASAVVEEAEEQAEAAAEPEAYEPQGASFIREREMQVAARKQLHVLEDGLKEADGGFEVQVSTGRIDILAEDARGDLVVIELKAGPCPPGAMEQALGYADDIERERDRKVRVFLIASEFSDRIRAAAKRVQGLELRTYSFSLAFAAVT